MGNGTQDAIDVINPESFSRVLDTLLACVAARHR
jgi:hypothetical protein